MKKVTRKEWLHRFKKIYMKGEFGYKKSIFRGSNIEIKIFHHKCKKYFKSTPSHHSSGRTCTNPKCKQETYNKKYREQQNDIEDKFDLIHDYKYIYNDNYRGMLDKTYKIKCLDHGIFTMRPHDHMSGQGCRQCGIIKSADSKRHTLKKVIKRFYKIFPKREYEYIGPYKSNHTPMIMKHIKCGTVFPCSPANHKAGTGCPRCKSSKGEKMLSIFFESQQLEYKIDFFTQKTFDDCKYGKKLRFDCYIVSGFILNKHDNYIRVWAVEYDGRQHTEIIEHWGGINEFIKLVKCDAIKNKYCKNNNISLIRIPYTIKTQNQIDNYLVNKFYNSTQKELDDHNSQLEKMQQQVIKEYKKKHNIE